MGWGFIYIYIYIYLSHDGELSNDEREEATIFIVMMILMAVRTFR